MKVDQFLENLIHFDKENIADNTIKAITPYLANKEFEPSFIRNKSIAAAGKEAGVFYNHNVYSFKEFYPLKCGLCVQIRGTSLS